MTTNTVADIRREFVRLKEAGEYVTDKSGVKMIEIRGASFIADEESIFGKVNEEYVARELEWYHSESLNVNDIPAPIPSIWKQVATPDGRINSNYGWMIFSKENGLQYHHCLEQLMAYPETRRAIMIYTRPSMQVDYNRDGMSDFCCTNTVQYLIRDGKLHAYVNMRSSDSIFGYKNDRAWALHVLKLLLEDYNGNTKNESVELGDVWWFSTSLHVYERHWNLIK